ncbi:MAG TPA: hypothetical protein VFV71_04240 [Burkholderiales bacterium]|nr:hypothetical protein [Burkholderiales bacterium]
MNDRFPLEQIIIHRGNFLPAGFAARAVEVLRDSDDYALEATREGVRLHAASEPALEFPCALLRDAFGDAIAFAPVTIKAPRHDGRFYHPVMAVRTSVPTAAQPAVAGTLRARGATMLEEDRQHGRVVTRACGSLRGLLGLPAALRKVAGDDARLWIWLSHYAPDDPEGGGKAA